MKYGIKFVLLIELIHFVQSLNQSEQYSVEVRTKKPASRSRIFALGKYYSFYIQSLHLLPRNSG